MNLVEYEYRCYNILVMDPGEAMLQQCPTRDATTQRNQQQSVVVRIRTVREQPARLSVAATDRCPEWPEWEEEVVEEEIGNWARTLVPGGKPIRQEDTSRYGRRLL